MQCRTLAASRGVMMGFSLFTSSLSSGAMSIGVSFRWFVGRRQRECGLLGREGPLVLSWVVGAHQVVNKVPVDRLGHGHLLRLCLLSVTWRSKKIESELVCAVLTWGIISPRLVIVKHRGQVFLKKFYPAVKGQLTSCNKYCNW